MPWSVVYNEGFAASSHGKGQRARKGPNLSFYKKPIPPELTLEMKALINQSMKVASLWSRCCPWASPLNTTTWVELPV